MNGKRAKALRKHTKDIIFEFAADKLLTPEQMESVNYNTVIAAVPYRILINKRFTKVNAIGTGRWFYKQVKKDPSITWLALKEKYYE